MTDARRPALCDRTARVVERVVSDTVTPDDHAHAATCAACGTVLARATRFDDELRVTVRGLVSEQLPYGILDPALSPQSLGGVLPVGRGAPGMASILAAVVVLLVATSVVIAPGGLGPGATPQDTGLHFQVPTFRATVDVIRDVRALDYGCIPGHALPTAGPGARAGEREGVVCLTPATITSAKASIIPVETGDGKVVEVSITGQLFGPSTVTSRDELAAAMGKLTFLAISDPAVAAEAGAFVEETLPRLRVLSTGDEVLMIFGDVRVFLQRHIAGDYLLLLQPV